MKGWRPKVFGDEETLLLLLVGNTEEVILHFEKTPEIKELD